MALEIQYNVQGCFRPPREDIKLAKAAVDAGFEGIWIGDHFMPWIDNRPYTHHPFPWFGSLMSEVSDVPVGTSVTCPTIRYRPPILAQQIATLDNMYPGRFNLGVGIGEALNEAHFLDNEWPDWHTLAEMLIESIEVMTELWSSTEYISYDGDHYQYEDIKLYTQPRAEIPIHWAGWGPNSCEYAGRFADHLITVESPETIQERIIPAFESGLEQSGRTLDDADISIEYSANVGDPDTLAKEIRELGEFIPVDELDNADPRAIQKEADERLSEMSDEQLVEQYMITRDPDPIVEQLEIYEEVGVDRILVGSQCGDPMDTIGLFGEHVIPEFR
jgi:coenzyme F420-dependent glucose-6-phosphate dehydrogenase